METAFGKPTNSVDTPRSQELPTMPLDMITNVNSDNSLNAALSEGTLYRSHQPLRAPARISHLVMLSREETADRDHLTALCRRLGGAEPPEEVKNWYVDLGEFKLWWECQAEFSVYIFCCEEPFSNPVCAPFSEPVINRVPHDWLDDLGGEMLVAAHLELEPRDSLQRTEEDLDALFTSDNITASKIAGGAAIAWTDLHPHPDGFSRFFIRNVSLSHHQASMLVQRLLEIETYVVLALLSSPLIREYGAQVSRIEQVITKLTNRMVRFRTPAEKQQLRNRLSLLVKDIKRINTATLFRFGTSKAYYALVQLRIQDLQEQPFEGRQTIQAFLEHLLPQIMFSCKTLQARLSQLSQRVSRIIDLLDTPADSIHR